MSINELLEIIIDNWTFMRFFERKNVIFLFIDFVRILIKEKDLEFSVKKKSL
jgi:hypothetical protein